MDIKIHQVKALRKHGGLNLTHYWILDWLNTKPVLPHEMAALPEYKKLQGLYLVDGNGCTESGKKFYEQIRDLKPEPVQKVAVTVLPDSKYWLEFSQWWQGWPRTKSVAQFKSTALMKSATWEKEIYYKYVGAIENEGMTPELMEHARLVYLKTAELESTQKGRNELQYRNNLQVWMNNKIYKDLCRFPIPGQEKKKVTEVSI